MAYIRWTCAMLALLAIAQLSCPGFGAAQPVLVPAKPGQGAKGIPAGPNAFTEKGLDRVRQQWYEKRMAEAYKGLGLRQPAWDQTALTLTADYYTLSRAGDVRNLLEAARPVMQAGCEDPLALYMVGVALARNDRPAEADPYLRKALEGYKKVAYPRSVAFLAPLWLSRVCYDQGGDKAAESHRWLDAALPWIAQGAAEPFADKEQRVFWEQVDVKGVFDSHMLFVANAIKKEPKADPWLREIILGEAAIEAAWDARGSGVAATVTEEGGKEFYVQLQKAHDHLVTAWKLHPDYPEAATSLITVAMGGVAGPGESERVWFDRAVAGQLDYREAYYALLQALLPRWGGSHEQMYKLGLECLATKRFDTAVPRLLYSAVWQIAEFDEESDFWKRPGVYQNLSAMYEGLLAEPSRAGMKDAINSEYAAVAWRCGAYQDARRLLDQLGGRADADGIQSMFKVPLARIRDDVYGATGGPPAGPGGAQGPWNAAGRLRAGGRFLPDGGEKAPAWRLDARAQVWHSMRGDR